MLLSRLPFSECLWISVSPHSWQVPKFNESSVPVPSLYGVHLVHAPFQCCPSLRSGWSERCSTSKAVSLCRSAYDVCVCPSLQAVELDISRQLLSYEVEYHVLQEEVLASPSHADSDLNKLGAMNQNLKRQVMDLLQQLQTSNDQLKR